MLWVMGPRMRRGVTVGSAAALVCMGLLMPSSTARADPPNVDFVDRLGCGSGLTPVATAVGAGSTLVPGLVTTTVRPLAQLSTTASGFPPVSVDFTNSPSVGEYDRFDYPAVYSGGALDPEYLFGALELLRPAPGATVAWDTVLPRPQRLFFTLLDFEFGAEETAAIIGFSGTTPVTPDVVSRALPGQTGVLITPQPDGSVLVTGQASATDFESNVTADVVFSQPVDRVHIEQINASTNAGSTFVEYTTMYGCQGLDLAKSSLGATQVAATTASRTFDVPFTLLVGNTAGPDDMALYAPHVDDDLTSLVSSAGGGPAGILDGINSLTVTGPAPACQPNAAYDGLVDTDLLVGAGLLMPGEQCVIELSVRVSFPTFADTFTRDNSATATSAGVATDLSTASATVPAAVHADTASATPITFAVPPAEPPPSTTTTTTTAITMATTTTTTTLAAPTSVAPQSPGPPPGTTTPPSAPPAVLPATGSRAHTANNVAVATAVVLVGIALTVLGHRRPRTTRRP